MAEVLIVDDDQMLCDMVSRKLCNLGHTATAASSLKEGLTVAQGALFDLVLLDVRLPDGSGLEEINTFKSLRSQPEILIITGEGDADGAKMAIETGAWDYIEKPLSMREIGLQLNQVLLYRQEKNRNGDIRLLSRAGIIGDAPQIESCLEQAALVANTDAPVLITGETGTGKELFARAVHNNSTRRDQPFIVLDCAAFPEHLVESMLFGHLRGAFTGAERPRDGLIMEAAGGTLFMDEVGELTLDVQRKFLRVLQEKCFRPVGGNGEIASDFRLVSATNRDLEKMVRAGTFREDLLYRLQASTIQLPPLRDRKSDIEPLVLHHLSAWCKQYGKDMKGVSQEFMEALNNYSWPGNVRELIHTIDAVMSAAQMHDTLFPIHLPPAIRVSVKQTSLPSDVATHVGVTVPAEAESTSLSLKETLERREKSYLENLVLRTHGDIKRICKISGLSRSGLYARLKKYGIERPL